MSCDSSDLDDFWFNIIENLKEKENIFVLMMVNNC